MRSRTDVAAPPRFNETPPSIGHQLNTQAAASIPPTARRRYTAFLPSGVRPGFVIDIGRLAE